VYIARNFTSMLQNYYLQKM